MLCPQPEGAPFTFSGEKVPAGRMRVFYRTHQSRCARQLSLRHANSPRGKLKMLCPQPEGAPFTFPVGEGARRAKKCLLPSPWGKVPAGRMRVFYYPHQSRCARQLSLRHASDPQGKLKMLCPQPEGAPFTFSGEKVPAGRMRVFYLTHQSRCARQLSLRHANSPRGKLKMLCPQPEGAPFTFPVGEGARRAKKCLLPSPGRRCPQGEGVPFTFSREKVPAGRMRIFYLTHQSRSARQLSLRHASSPRGS